jgi:hypothetical protein
MRKRACDWCARRLRHLPATFSRHFANLIHAYRGDSGALFAAGGVPSATLSREWHGVLPRPQRDLFRLGLCERRRSGSGTCPYPGRDRRVQGHGCVDRDALLLQPARPRGNGGETRGTGCFRNRRSDRDRSRGEAHCDDSSAHRIRGEILLRCNPPNPSVAAKAFSTACHIAEEQGARGFRLLAALPLAKLCYSSARFTEAKTVLASALEGFTPTPEMPEIAAALALLSAIDERA